MVQTVEIFTAAVLSRVNQIIFKFAVFTVAIHFINSIEEPKLIHAKYIPSLWKL